MPSPVADLPVVLSAKQREVLRALLEGADVDAVATQCDVSQGYVTNLSLALTALRCAAADNSTRAAMSLLKLTAQIEETNPA